MPRFSFRLQTLLTMRGAERSERCAQLAESLAAADAIARRQHALAQELDRQQQRFRRGVAPGQINVDRLLSSDGYERSLRGEWAALVEREQALLEQIARRQEAVAAADREVKVLEKLRDRQWERFRSAQALAEISQLDEAAGRTSGRGKSPVSCPSRPPR